MPADCYHTEKTDNSNTEYDYDTGYPAVRTAANIPH